MSPYLLDRLALYKEQKLEERILAAFESCGKKALAWGELGLNFAHPAVANNPKVKQEQIECFERQLELAIARGGWATLVLQTGQTFCYS